MSYTLSAFSRDGEPTTLATAEDVLNFIAQLMIEADESADDTAAHLYVNERSTDDEDGLPDHELRVGIDPESSTGALRYTDLSGQFYARGTESGRAEVRYFHSGHADEYPTDSVVPLDVIRRSLIEMLSTGTRPTAVQWAPLQ
ncbi:Imm1 family immunity protein [Kribbella sp. CA-293567]|uniref:Imm1 family immunity protein n=1 Tax=Kribbella sp. CA-293567 TaxID=3002436 RepID=UPI0022DDCDA6|nr:Imm1 family immunity protein [Kribbella sp. CA-293567]WBQ06250.1 Imm1 family immunity protein [Kribbella sp. CA-293567]